METGLERKSIPQDLNEDNFDKLVAAASGGYLCIMLATNKETGKMDWLVTIVHQDEEKNYMMFPVAVMADDLTEKYVDPQEELDA